MSANLEFIDRLSTPQEQTENEHSAFVRHYRALDDIQLLMETLLWVNRQSDNLLTSELIDLRLELDSEVENCSYLLDERDVWLTVSGSREATAPAVAVHIVLSNLVRNAFQHTMDGEVRTTITFREVSIENSISAGDNIQHDYQYGFGLGLELVSLICQSLGWHCSSTEALGCRTTTVKL